MKPKGDIPHLRYLFDRKTHLAYRRLMKTLINSQAFDHSDVAQFRLKVLEYYGRWGLRPTLDAFGVSKTSLYRWRQSFRRSGRKLISLVPQSTRPHHLRQMTTDPRLIACIGALRKAKGNMGSHILKPYVDAVAKQEGLTPISIKTIEKIIKRYHFTYEGKQRYKRKPIIKRLRSRYAPRVSAPGFIQVDSIIVHQDGYCFRFVSMIDIFTKLAYVTIVNRLTAITASVVFQQFQTICLYPIHTVQTDNGSEFLGEFDQQLNKQGITHLFIYPHSPKINGVVERFNRTIQEEFISRSDDLFLNRDLFRVKLTKYLDWYNTKRPHSALHYQAPMQFINQIPKCP